MAKVQGPLMSMQATGTFAKTLVFGTWKGRQVVRQHVTPSNPQSAAQEVARNKMRLTAIAQAFANLTVLKRAGETVTDKSELISKAPSGQAWNGFLTKSIIGIAGANYTTSAAAWAALTAPQKAAYSVSADALVPAIPAVVQTGEGGTPATALTSGQAFFMYLYGLYFATVADAPPSAATPPVYA